MAENKDTFPWLHARHRLMIRRNQRRMLWLEHRSPAKRRLHWPPDPLATRKHWPRQPDHLSMSIGFHWYLAGQWYVAWAV